MMRFTLLAILLVTGQVFAQTAKVIALSPEDATRAKQLSFEKDEAFKALDKFTAEIGQKYTRETHEGPSTACVTMFPAPPCDPPKPTEKQRKASAYYLAKEGWASGFEFSEDFKYIVPRTGGQNCNCPPNMMCSVTTCWPPAYSTPLNAAPITGTQQCLRWNGKEMEAVPCDKGVSFTDFNRQWEGPHLTHRSFMADNNFIVKEGSH